MFKTFFRSLSLAAAAILLSMSTVIAQETSPTATPTPTPTEMTVVEGPTFAAEELIVLDEIYAGPVFVAGGSITMSGEVQQDLIVAGGTIRITGLVDQDVYAAGGTVLIDGQVNGNVIAAGGEVQIGPGAEIGGSLLTGTERLSMAGILGGTLYAGANRLSINGPVGGDAWLGGETLELGEQASIAGDLKAKIGETYSPAPEATVAGSTDVQKIEKPEKTKERSFGGVLIKGVFRLVWRFALLALLIFFTPGILKTGVTRLSQQPGGLFMAGVVTMIGLPFLMLVLAMTVVGIPLAGIIFLLYLLTLLTVWAVPSMWVGQRILPQQGEYLQALIGVAVVVALGLLPIAGSLIQLMIAVFGFGLTMAMLRQSLTVK